MEALAGPRHRGCPCTTAAPRAVDAADLRIGALGSGSDYTPFLQHHGTASLNLSFGGLDDDGIYHSIYDDFYHFKKFSDPGFLYGRALAQLVGTAVIRLADADILPYEFTGLADTVQTYVAKLQDLLKRRQDEVTERNRQMTDGVFAAVNDPQRPRPIPPVEDVPPALNFAPLENAAIGADARGRPLAKSPGGGARAGGRRYGTASGDECPADAKRAAVHRRAGVAAPRLVPASPLCARVLHRLRREDDARRAGGD